MLNGFRRFRRFFDLLDRGLGRLLRLLLVQTPGFVATLADDLGVESDAVRSARLNGDDLPLAKNLSKRVHFGVRHALGVGPDLFADVHRDDGICQRIDGRRSAVFTGEICLAARLFQATNVFAQAKFALEAADFVPLAVQDLLLLGQGLVQDL